jgi:TonB family protein
MTNKDDKGVFLISAIAAGAIHVLLAGAALYLSLNAFQNLPAVTEVHLVANEYTVNAGPPIVERRMENRTTGAAEKTIPAVAEKKEPISQTTADSKTSSSVIQTIERTPKSSATSGKLREQISKKIAIVAFRFGDPGAPDWIRKVQPVYPFIARRMNKEGRVLLKLAIDERGKLLNAEVVEAAGFGFTESALEAVKKSTYRPAVKNGAPAPSLALLPVRFKLTDQQGDGF